MYEGHSIAVVVPAYNEAELIGSVLESMPSIVDRVYAVDDCSTDATWAAINRHVEPGRRAPRVDNLLEVRDYDAFRRSGQDPTVTDGGARSPTVVPLRHETNRGVGAAITTGYEQSLADEMDVTAVMAGDGQMDPEQLTKLLDPIVDGRVAYAKGNRLLTGADRKEMSNWRRFGNLTLSALTKIATGYWGLMDPQNGYTAISRRALETISLETLYERYGFTNDLLGELNTHGFQVADVAMPARYGREESDIRYRSFIPNCSQLLCRRFLTRLHKRYLLADFHPLVLLYALGFVGGLAGTAHLVAVVRRRQSAGNLAVYWFLSALTTALAMTFDRLENDSMVIQYQ